MIIKQNNKTEQYGNLKIAVYFLIISVMRLVYDKVVELVV